jgi:hypothetical protein
MYTTPEEMQQVIDKYFAGCEGRPLMGDDGQPVLDRYGKPVMIGQHPPTVTGLALALGLSSRQALLNYQAKDEYNDTITRAKARIEAYTEARLFDKDGVQGAKFSLSNNFSGWSEKQEITQTITARMVQPVTIADLEAEIAEKKHQLQLLQSHSATRQIPATLDTSETK